MGSAYKTLNYTNLQGSLVGRYRLENLLGMGGMGNVYKSHHPDLKRDIAVKILHPHFTQTPGFIERFRHEAAAAGSLVHPRIIQVYDFNVSDGGLYYMVMQFINGPSLEEYLSLEREPLTLSHAYRILAPVAAALHFAHEQGIIHRDIKPGNILLDTRQNPFLGDFGLAKIVGVDLQTAAEFGPGTPAYMAPEQIENGELSRATDIYGLGLVLYKMLTMRLPFEGASLLQLIRRKTMEPARSPTDFNSQLPDEVVNVILRAIAIDPSARFPDAVTFIEAYQEAVDKQGVSVPRFDLGTAISSGFVSLPGIYVEGYKIQREFIEPHNRPYQRYLAKNETLNELAVLTVLKSTPEANPILASLFRERLDKLALLDHPTIFAITRVGITPDNHPYCAYAFTPGQTLAAKLSSTWQQAESALPATEALSLLRQIAESLVIATQANLWHNDLHPAHIIITDKQAPVLVGWEIPLPPSLVDNQSGQDEPGYIAPEQLAGGGVTVQSYLFCLGIMAHELLTGQRPQMTGWRTRPYAPADILPARPIHQPDTVVTPETQYLLSHCLATSPADRFPDMSSFLTQLDKAVTAEQHRLAVPITTSPNRQTVLSQPRHWATALLLVLLLLLLLISGGIYQQWVSNTTSGGQTPTSEANTVTPTLIGPVLVMTAALPSPTAPTDEVVAVISPTAGSQFTLEERITFAWNWPLPLADSEQFAVYFLGREDPILVGVVTAPMNTGSQEYRLVVQGQDVISTTATYVWQVQLTTSDRVATPRASSQLSLITFVVQPSATPSPTPTLTRTSTQQPTPSPTKVATATQTPTATVRVCQKPANWITYQVQSGDTWPGLATLTGATVNEILLANCLQPGIELTVGQTLWLPISPATVTPTPTPQPAPAPSATPLPALPSPTPSVPAQPTFTPPALPTFTPPANPDTLADYSITA